MSTAFNIYPTSALRHELDALRGNWIWFALPGVVLVAVGCVALAAPWVASVATALVLGTLLAVSGVAEMIGSFWSRRWSGFFLHLLSGVLALVVGALFLRAPEGAVLTLTMLLACFLTVGGLFKIIAALSHRFVARGWPMLSGAIDLVLGVLISLDWPASALWVIGLFAGISLVFRGANWIGPGLALRAVPGGGRRP